MASEWPFWWEGLGGVVGLETSLCKELIAGPINSVPLNNGVC